ncbi:putative E3 ubiquitin-protein ligase HERC1 [Morus notabilis]|uniref:Putative E3 ubiquitin-protein ligase HERC1 n=1 Tax=Morus notabilis TaxID=981085 RepID=W9QMX2_9ROSA|nr:PH, RCC1 and FYVE domains-containing protein 1 [Morus notabilis]EXB43469.1 putative E3 ubiquitin-protein ligase HERC1 [Morus notabilis]
MADSQRSGIAERDIEQAITALKKGACLLKYGRRGKPKFCPFRLSNDESLLIWYSGKEEKHVKLSHVSRIIPGQRTAIFQRYPRPEKEYQSFSLIYGDRSLDLICKDKDEAEVWFVGLNALITRDNYCKWRTELISDNGSVDSPNTRTRRNSPSITPFDPGDTDGVNFENVSQSRLGKAFADIVTYTAVTKRFNQAGPVFNPSLSPASVDNSNGRSSAAEVFRVSLSSAISSSSQGSCHDDFDALGDVFMWGEGIGGGILGGGVHRVGSLFDTKMDALLPKALESTVVLDVHGIACGGRHAVLVTRQGEIFSWGEEAGGRLGHGVKVDVSQPKLIDVISGSNVELVACGEYHSCAVTLSGELYTWGDGTHSSSLLGHGSEVSHWIPKKVCGPMEGIHVSYISCGLWHTAVVTSAGQLFTFGDGSFGALGHGDLSSTSIPREVETLRGLKTTRVSCGVWHTAAVVEIINELSSHEPSGNSSSGQLFTWGDGDKGQLGHDDKKPRLVPVCVTALVDKKICQVACGHTLTIALTTSGQVYTMGSTAYGQLGNPTAEGKVPTQVKGKIAETFVEEIACGSYHVAVLTSKTEVYTWGKGSNGQLGHGDNDHRDAPTLVDFLKNKQVKSVACGSNITAVICLHKWASSADHSVCFGCHNPFGFRRKRHNCYNCGLVFCKVCSSKKCMKAALAPNMNKPYRVCDDCYTKLQQAMESSSILRNTKSRNGNGHHKTVEVAERETRGPKLQATLSRFSSFSSANQVESWHSRGENQLEANYSYVFPLLSGAPNSVAGGPKKVTAASVPVSRVISRATSPISLKLSPPWSSEETDLKHANESLNQEIMILRAQVEDLTHKSQNLEAELENTAKQLNEVTAIAADEAEKSKSAKEVIKSLTAQLKEMAERLPEGHTISCSTVPTAARDTNFSNQISYETTLTNMNTPERESNGNSVNQILSNGSKAQQTGKTEWVMQDEPGVYITLSSLPGGGNELKRVRFSRKHFTEEQAERWWAENGAKTCERHNVRSE